MPDTWQRSFVWPIGMLGLGALILGLYWNGLSGPLVLDDLSNLRPVEQMLAGQLEPWAVIFDNRSGPLGRPLSMASFVVDGRLFGFDVWHFKLTNVLIHVGSGALLLVLLRKLLPRDQRLARHALWLAPLLAAIWLLLPIHVSSVLYVIQRMALLSGFFMLAALVVFVMARTRIEAGQKTGQLLLWFAFPLLVGLATLAKENGVLAIPLALVIEWLWFRRASLIGPRAVNLFFIATLALPAAAVLAYLAINPQTLLAGYATRDFTPIERMLTQPRVLWDYVGAIAVPITPTLGLFNDDFPLSTGWLTPWTTVPAILAWLIVFTCAWRCRHAYPALLGGVLFFLTGHAIESTVWPLEIHFEHRNYLPSVGVLLAAAGLIAWVADRLPAPSAMFRKSAPLVLVLVLAVLAWGTHARAQSWSSLDAFFAQAIRASPESPRLHSYLAGLAADRGDLPAALHHVDAMERGLSVNLTVVAPLWRVFAHCLTNQPQAPALLDELEREAKGSIRAYAGIVWESLSQRLERGACPGLDEARFRPIITRWVLDNPEPASSVDSWRPRMNLARYLAARGELKEAAAVADRAWIESEYNRGLGILNFQLHATLANESRCREILAILERSRGLGDRAFDEALDLFANALREGLEPVGSTSTPIPRAGPIDDPAQATRQQ